MKRTILSPLKAFYLIVLACLLLFTACGRKPAPEFRNYPLPSQPDTLRILGWGNSFTDDGMAYLPDLLEAAGIHNVILGRLYIGGCSLERHCRELADTLDSYIYYKSVANEWRTVSSRSSAIAGLADEPWDVVVTHQVSGLSGRYETFHPWLEQMMQAVRTYSPNKRTAVAWQQTWAYARSSTHPDFPNYACSQDSMYRAIAGCVQQLLCDTPLRIFVPSGVAIQDLRMAAAADSLDFTRDGYHLDYRMGRYTAACCWFETLVAPALGVSVRGNSFRMQGTPDEITPEQAAVCQEMAYLESHRR